MLPGTAVSHATLDPLLSTYDCKLRYFKHIKRQREFQYNQEKQVPNSE